MTLHESVRETGGHALAAARRMVRLSSAKKNAILLAMAETLNNRRRYFVRCYLENFMSFVEITGAFFSLRSIH